MLHYQPKKAAEEAAVVAQMQALSRHHPRFGYRRVGVLAGLKPTRAWRLWKKHGFQLEKPRRRRKRHGSDQRPHKAERPNQVWTYDFIHDRLANGQGFKTLNVVDEYTRECLAIHVAQSIRGADVVKVLAGLIHQRGAPTFIRSDNGSEFTARVVERWLTDSHIGPSYIEPGHPWQNGFIESFHSRFRDECLSREWFRTMTEARCLIEEWRRQYNTERPHSSLGYQTPAQYAAAFKA